MGFPVQNLIMQPPRKGKHKAGALDAPVRLVALNGQDVTQAANVADLTADPTQADFNNLLKALRDAGLMADA